MTLDEVSSTTGKKSVVFKQKEKKNNNIHTHTHKKKKKKAGKIELNRRGQLVGPKHTLELIQLKLSDFNLSVVFLTKTNLDFGLDMINT